MHLARSFVHVYVKSMCELCFVLHFHSFIVPLAVLFVDLVHSILLFALQLSRPSCNQVVSDCFWNIKLTYLLTYLIHITTACTVYRQSRYINSVFIYSAFPHSYSSQRAGSPKRETWQTIFTCQRPFINLSTISVKALKELTAGLIRENYLLDLINLFPKEWILHLQSSIHIVMLFTSTSA